jgi:hypothetical protein
MLASYIIGAMVLVQYDNVDLSTIRREYSVAIDKILKSHERITVRESTKYYHKPEEIRWVSVELCGDYAKSVARNALNLSRP